MTKKQSIVVLGSGMAGLRCTLNLADRIGRRKDIEIILIDKYHYHTLHSSLFSYLSKAPAPSATVPISSLLKKRPIRFIEDIVTRIDPFNRSITLHEYGKLAFDYLVIALGGVPHDQGLSKLHSSAYFFHTYNDAIMLRQALRQRVKNHRLTNLVIVGGGLLGIELAGFLSSYRHDLCNNCDSKHSPFSITVIEKNSQILPGLSKSTVRACQQFCKANGIDIYTGVTIKSVKEKELVLTNHYPIPYDILVWTAGTKVQSFYQPSNLPLDETGRIRVNKLFQVRGFSRIYAIGDSASYRNEDDHIIASHGNDAIWQASAAADNITRQVLGHHPRPATPRLEPTIIALGDKNAVIELGQLSLSGSWIARFRRDLEYLYLKTILPSNTAAKLIYGQKR